MNTFTYRTLGRTGLKVSPLALGGSAFTYPRPAQGWDPHSDAGRKSITHMLHHALDQGINYIDTAPLYGQGLSELMIGEVMKSRRNDCVLASKVWYELDHDEVIDSVHQSLRRLQTDHIDILQIHGRMYRSSEIRHLERDGVIDALLELRAAGKIVHIGITSEEPFSLMHFLDHPDISVYQIAYNFIYQAAARHFLIEAAEKNVGVVSMRTMTSGVLQHEAQYLAPHWREEELYEVALKFVLSDSRVHSALVGTCTPQEVTRNIELARAWNPSFDFAHMPRLTMDIIRTQSTSSMA